MKSLIIAMCIGILSCQFGYAKGHKSHSHKTKAVHAKNEKKSNQSEDKQQIEAKQSA